MNRRIFTPIVAVVFIVAMAALSGCGGGSGGRSSASRSLPPDPGSAASATLTGVDVNRNGVRDEVEIDISSNTPKDVDFSKTMAVAKALNNVLTMSPPTTRQEALKIQASIICAASSQGEAYGGDNQNYLVEKTFDTPERKQKYVAVGQMLGGGFDAAEAIEAAPCAN